MQSTIMGGGEGDRRNLLSLEVSSNLFRLGFTFKIVSTPYRHFGYLS